MFFKKNKKEENKTEKSAASSDEYIAKDVEIHVMPSKFLTSDSNGNKKKKALLITAGVLLLFLFVLLIIFFIFKDNIFPPKKLESAPPKIETSPVKETQGKDDYIEQESVNIATGTEEIITEPIMPDKILCNEFSDCLWRSGLPERLGGCGCFSKSYLDYLDSLKNIYEENDVIIQCESPASLEPCECVLNKCQMSIAASTEIATTTDEIIATTTSEIIATSTAQNLDSDKDGLSDKEEDLFLSDKFLADTDGDGYLDGLEVANLYDPKISAPAKITDGGDAVKSYNENRYSLLYPKLWEAAVSEEGKVIFSAGDGEFVELLISPNQDSLSIIDWYKAQTSEENENQGDFQETNNKNYLKVLKTDHTVYINDYNYIYILTYNPINYETGTSTENYSAVFSMMRQSFNSKIDTDGDGIVDYKEIEFYKTDPLNVDTDGDGHNDGEEILHGYDPLK